jgi:hypothetical protein
MTADIRKILEYNYQCKVVVKKNTKDSDDIMEKLLFIEIINLLKEAEDRGGLIESIGVNLQEYESLYVAVINNLFRLYFSESQLEIINYYIYQLPFQEDFKGILEVIKGRKTVSYKFETPEDLWEVLKNIK